MDMRGFERRMSLGFVVASAAIFAISLLLVPPFGATFDEAKYLGIGFSMIEGRGPQIVFGGYFLPHAPLWPTVVVAPAVALGIDPLVVGRFLNALSGLGLILLSAALAWRIRPAAAALAAIGLLATTVLHEFTRTARLDVPSATLAVAYLALGLLAVRRGSARCAIAAGLLFGVAFLVKEVVLPLAPVPILAAILHRQPWRPIMRTAGWLLLTSTIVVAPWFIFVADVGNRVYRLGTPVWTLAPIGIALLALGVAGIIAGRVYGPTAAAEPTAEADGHRRTWLVLAITIAWAVALTLVFTGALARRATALIDVEQITSYLRQWYPFLITTGIGAIGVALSVPWWRTAARRPREAVEDLWLATICGLPLVILVVGVGEGPRNYLAQLAIGAGVAGAGWVWLYEAAIRRWTTLTIMAVGVAFGPVIGLLLGDLVGLGRTNGAIAGLVAGAIVAAAVALAVRARRRAREPERDSDFERPLTQRGLVGLMTVGLIGATSLLAFTIELREPTTTREDAVTTVAAWVEDNVEPGSTIAFGSYLGYEMALPLRADYTLRQVRHQVVAGDAEAPDGMMVFGKPKTDDWVSADIAPKNINEFQSFSAGTLIAQLRKYGIDYWVYSTGTTTSASTIISALDGAAGFEKVADWTFERPRGGEPITTSVYRLDLDRLALDADRLYMAPDALERMVALIESEHATDLARRLAPQVVPAPQSAATDVLMDRLRALGQP